MKTRALAQKRNPGIRSWLFFVVRQGHWHWDEMQTRLTFFDGCELTDISLIQAKERLVLT